AAHPLTLHDALPISRPPRRRTAPVREPERRGPGRRKYSHRATLLTSPGSDRVDSSVKLRQPDHHWYTLGERRPPTRDGGARSGVGRTTVSRHAAGGDEDRWQSSQTRTPAGRLRAGPLPGPGRARPPLQPWPGRPGPAPRSRPRPGPPPSTRPSGAGSTNPARSTYGQPTVNDGSVRGRRALPRTGSRTSGYGSTISRPRSDCSRPG